MSSTKNKSTKNQSTAAKNSNKSRSWVIGLIITIVGIYMFSAILAYLFQWKADCSALADLARFKGNSDRIAMITFENPCGKNGAIIADWFIGQTFGLFGIVIPIVLIALGIRLLRNTSLRINRILSVGALILLFGMLTLGFIFKNSWGIFGTGLGGQWGIDAATLISQSIGSIGTILVIIGGWILTGVYINRSFINKVNHMGELIADGGKKVGMAARDIVVKGVEKSHSQTAVPTTNTEQTATETAENYNESDANTTHTATPTTTNTPVAANEQAEEEDDDILGISSVNEEQQAAPQEVKPISPNKLIYEDEDLTVTTSTVPTATPIATTSAVAEVQGNSDVAESATNDKPTAVTDENVDEDGLQIVVHEHKDKELSAEEIDLKEYDPAKDLPNYQRPPITLLEDHSMDVEVSSEEIFENKEQIKTTLRNFSIEISKIKATVGPTVTLYEIIPAPGIKIARIKALEEDIAMSLKALRIRIIAPIPGKGTVGIEVPNKDRDVVSMLSAVKSARFQQCKYELPVVIGRTIQNENFVIDLAKMPHLLVAGATGQGKSVGLNAIITSLLYKKHPSELKFVMIDPKRVELSLYAPLEKHFLAKMESEDESILTDPQKVIYTLNSLVVEMEQRYELLRQASVKKITEYNEKFRNRRLNPQKGHRFLPYLVVVVDEFADLIMTAGREIETPIVRLAQMGRAVGLHMIIATQRPEVKVITGLIKSNFPARIAFRVMSMMDSRTIIDTTGANQLIGCGDMLMSLNSELTRVQCAFVDTPEIENIISFISRQQGYTAPYALPDYVPENSEAPSAMSGEAMRFDPKLAEIARWFVQNGGQASTSSIQRNFEVGFNRAGRIMNQLERAGIVGRQEGSKPRDLKVTDTYALERILQDLGIS